ncbi:MAG: DHH family phosphoesterase, partial [Thermoleophilia bacterium]|nr:DHH family phosphoesterase [Thermoleophilia bacterium]
VRDALKDPTVRWAVTSHENPDGDALGSLLGAARALSAAGRDVVLAHPNGRGVPDDIAFLIDEGETLLERLPEDVGERTLLTLDCASETRLWDGGAPWGAGRVINVDHHHDNSLFGHLNIVAPTASSAAEVAYDLIKEAGLPVDRKCAEALYVGLITDTGNFTYSNTSPHSHRTAAELIGLGIDHAEIARRLYEQQPAGRIRLLGRAIERSQILMDGLLMVSDLRQEDFRELEATDTETVVEVLRSVEGVEAAALLRELDDGRFRASLRTSRPDVDVSIVARKEGGGGHRAAAGFTSDRQPAELYEWIVDELRAQS